MQLMAIDYRGRIVDSVLTEMLQYRSAVLLEGVRACGKSATGRHHSASAVQLDIDNAALRLAELDPGRLLRGEMPRFIDEWQLVPALWNQVRTAVDRDPEARFLLAGSAVPADQTTRHSGAGRILRIRMRPMSLTESGDSSGDVSLRELFENPEVRVAGESTLTVDALTEVVVRGGWPGLLELPLRLTSGLLASYLDDVARVDIPRLDGEPERAPEGILRTIRSVARSVGTEASLASIAADISANTPTTPETVSAYLAAMGRVFVVEDQPSWSPHLRSRDRVRKAAKRHFVDPSLAAAAVGADAHRLLDDLSYFGQLFESLVVRDLRIYSQPLDGSVYHYRDSSGNEVDAIIERRDGSYLAVEVKLAASREDEAAASLHRFVAKLDPERTPAPTGLVVITGGRYAFTRPDGVHVIPLGSLSP